MLYRFPLVTILLLFTAAPSARAQAPRRGPRLGAQPSSAEHEGPAQLRVRPRCAQGMARDSRWGGTGDVEVCHDARVKMVGATPMPSRGFGARSGHPGGWSVARTPMQGGGSRSLLGSKDAAMLPAQREIHRPRTKAGSERSYVYRNGVRPHPASATVDPLPFSEGEGTGNLLASGWGQDAHGPVFVVVRVARITPGARAYSRRSERAAKKIARRRAKLRGRKTLARRTAARGRQP